MKKEHKKLFKQHIEQHKQLLKKQCDMDKVGFTNEQLFDDIYLVLETNIDLIADIIGGKHTSDILGFWVFDMSFGEMAPYNMPIRSKDSIKYYKLKSINDVFKLIDKLK